MKFLESDLENIIFDADVLELKKRGLGSYWSQAHTYKQLQIGNYGIADIVQFNRRNDIIHDIDLHYIIPYIEVNVIELKKDIVNSDTFFQAIRYCKGILEYISERSCFSIDCRFNITLIGKSIDNSDFIYMKDIINSNDFSLDLYTYDYKFDGIYFSREPKYKLTNSGLKKKLSHSKYKNTTLIIPTFLF